MPPASWSGAAVEFVATWIAMMMPMMLPSLVPALCRYRRSVLAAGALAPHGLVALVGLGYVVVWAVLGVVVHASAAALAAIETRWEWLLPQSVLTGAALLLAGLVQVSSWKARQLARCRNQSDCAPVPTAPGAWRHGLELGLRCALSCGNLMLALLAIGMMDPVAMAVVTLVVTAERLAPTPRLLARLAGVATAAAGVLTIVAS